MSLWRIFLHNQLFPLKQIQFSYIMYIMIIEIFLLLAGWNWLSTNIHFDKYYLYYPEVLTSWRQRELLWRTCVSQTQFMIKHYDRHYVTHLQSPLSYSLSHIGHCQRSNDWQRQVFLAKTKYSQILSKHTKQKASQNVPYLQLHTMEPMSFCSGGGPEWTYLLPRPMGTGDLWPSSHSPRLPHCCRPQPAASSPRVGWRIKSEEVHINLDKNSDHVQVYCGLFC